MGYFSGAVTKLSRILDGAAGVCMVAIMALVVANILLRELTDSSILGTFEYVGFLTAVMIGFAIAYCAVQNGHIAVGFVVDRLPKKAREFINIFIYAVAFVFWLAVAWSIKDYAAALVANGTVSPTTQTPYYPFVYLLAFGLFVFCLVLLIKLAESVKRMAAGK